MSIHSNNPAVTRRLSRRTLLKVGAGSVAALGAGTALAGPTPEIAATEPGSGRWPNRGHGPGNRAHSAAAVGPGDDPTVAWTTRFLGSFDHLIVEGDALYLTRPGEVIALGTAEGRERWRTRVSAAAEGPSFVASDGERIFYLDGHDRTAAAVDRDGALLWRRGTARDGVGGLVVADGALYCGTGGTVVVRDAATGRRRWRQSIDGAGRAAAAVADGRLYVGGAGRTYGFVPRRGPAILLDGPREAWAADGPWRCSTPVVADDRVLVGADRPPAVNQAGSRSVTAYDGAGTRVWQRDLGHRVTAPAVGDGLAFAAGVEYAPPDASVVVDASRVAALASSDGTERWRYPTEGELTRPVVAGGRPDGAVVYVGEYGTGDSRIHALAAADGTRIWTASVDGNLTDLAVVGGTLYGLTDYGQVYAIR